MNEQFERIKQDVHCHYQELTALNIKKQTQTNPFLEQEIIKIHKLIIAKNALLKTLSDDYGLGNVDTNI